MTTKFPLLQRLINDLGFPILTPDTHDQLMAEHDNLVLFFAGSPNRYPESNDVAVILPEIIKVFEDQLTAVLVPEEFEDVYRQRYPFDMWPGLVFVKKGMQIGTICKVQDWSEYMVQIKDLLEKNSHVDNLIPTQSIIKEA